MTRARTGDRRKRNQPLNIDRLPIEVREAIQYLKNMKGKTWQQIEELSALPFEKEWRAKEGVGFIDWTTVPVEVLELFPSLRLPHANLHRWYDLRVDQVRGQILKENERVASFVEALASKTISNGNAAVINTMRDQVFALIDSVGTGDREMLLKRLASLTLAITRMERVELQRRRVEADLAKIDAERAKLAAEAGDPREIYLLASQDLLKKLRTREAVRTVIDPIKEDLIQEFTHGAEAFAKQVEASAS